METTVQKRKPRLRPVGSKRDFSPTQRLYETLYGLYRYHLLDAHHLRALVRGSEQKTTRWLHELFHAGLIIRYNTKTDLSKPGSEPLVYALTDKGADLLSELFITVPRLKVRYNDNNRRRSLAKVRHDLMVSEIMVRFELACAASPRASLIDQESILDAMPEATRDRQYPRTWRAPVPGHPHGVGTAPDHVFGIHDTARPEGKDRAFFFLEADRGSEVNKPTRTQNLTRTTIYKKMLTYTATHKHQLHRKHFDIPNFRVLWVTVPIGTDREGRTRLENMMAAARDVTDGKVPELFLFTDYETFRSGNPLTDVAWYTAKGEERTII